MARNKLVMTKKESEALKPADRDALQKLYKALGGDCQALTSVINAVPHLLGLTAEFETDESVIQAYMAKHKPAMEIEDVVPGKQMQLSFFELEYHFELDRNPHPIFVLIARYPWSRKLYVRVSYNLHDPEWTKALCDCFYQNGVPDEIIYDTDLPTLSGDTEGICCQFRPENLWFCEHFGMKRPICIPSTAQQKREMRQIAKKIQNVALPWANHTYGLTDHFNVLEQRVQDWVERCESVQSQYVAYIGEQQFKGNAKELYEIERKYLQFVYLPENAFVISMYNVYLGVFEKLKKEDFPIELPYTIRHSYGTFSILSTGHYLVLKSDRSFYCSGYINPISALSLRSLFREGCEDILFLQRK